MICWWIVLITVLLPRLGTDFIGSRERPGEFPGGVCIFWVQGRNPTSKAAGEGARSTESSSGSTDGRACRVGRGGSRRLGLFGVALLRWCSWLRRRLLLHFLLTLPSLRRCRRSGGPSGRLSGLASPSSIARSGSLRDRGARWLVSSDTRRR